MAFETATAGLGWSIPLRLIGSAIFGGMIGFERETHSLLSGYHGMAGIRTHMLVCVGCCLIQIMSVHGYSGGDPSRLAAAGIQGIGFIGAGAVVHQTAQNIVHGLTTASTIWLVMAIGLSTGLGWWFISGFITLLALLVLTLFRVLWRNYCVPSIDKVQWLTAQTPQEVVVLRVELYTNSHASFTDSLEREWCDQMEILQLHVEKHRQHELPGGNNRVALLVLMKLKPNLTIDDLSSLLDVCDSVDSYSVESSINSQAPQRFTSIPSGPGLHRHTNDRTAEISAGAVAAAGVAADAPPYPDGCGKVPPVSMLHAAAAAEPPGGGGRPAAFAPSQSAPRIGLQQPQQQPLQAGASRSSGDGKRAPH